MCGIAGEITAGASPREQDWAPLVDAMWRRGPDAGHVWSDDRCVIGCRRLAIMDPGSRADLPLVSPDGRWALGFNGELYGTQSAARALSREGWRFRTRSDSEIALAALALHGVEALRHFNGMYALAVYDADRHELLLARDHAGIKPLYVDLHADGLAFASELETLLTRPGAPPFRLRPEAIEAYLRLGLVPSAVPVTDSIRMLDPGAWLRWSAREGVVQGRHFELSSDAGDLRGDEADEALESALRSAVRRHLQADVPVGAFLSGGIDSPLIAAIASKVTGGDLETFSLAAEDAELDESADASRYAAAIGTRHRTSMLRGADAVELFETAVEATKEPAADEGILPTLALSQHAKQHVGVALSGEGADELFYGYVQRLRPVLDASPVEPRARAAAFAELYLELDVPAFRRCFPETTFGSAGDSLLVSAPIAGLPEWVRQHEYERFLPYVLLKTDRASMFHSLEVRVPFLDLEVLDVAARLDPTSCFTSDGALGKLPLRRLLRDRTGLETRAKRGFTAPVDSWVRGPLSGLAVVAADRLAGLEDVDHDPAAIQAMVSDHHAGRVSAGMMIWRLMVLDAWVTKVRTRLAPTR